MTPAAGIRYVPFKDGATLKTLRAGLPPAFRDRMTLRLEQLNVPADWTVNIVFDGEPLSEEACWNILNSVEWAREVRGAGSDVGNFPAWIYWLAGGLVGTVIALFVAGYFHGH